MVGYQVGFSVEGQADYDGLAPGPRAVAKAFARRLANGPSLPGSKRLVLVGNEDVWRIRAGRSNWRIIFILDRPNRRITITDIKRRSVVYQHYPYPQGS